MVFLSDAMFKPAQALAPPVGHVAWIAWVPLRTGGGRLLYGRAVATRRSSILARFAFAPYVTLVDAAFIRYKRRCEAWLRRREPSSRGVHPLAERVALAASSSSALAMPALPGSAEDSLDDEIARGVDVPAAYGHFDHLPGSPLALALQEAPAANPNGRGRGRGRGQGACGSVKLSRVHCVGCCRLSAVAGKTSLALGRRLAMWCSREGARDRSARDLIGTL